MITWCPVFSKIVDSSIWLEPDWVIKVFLTMIAKKDRDQIVRGNAFMIANWAKKTEQETLDALKILSSPDTRRIEPQPFDGRRIEKCGDGWLVLNGQQYEDLMRDINRKNYKAKWERDKRASSQIKIQSWMSEEDKRMVRALNRKSKEGIKDSETPSNVEAKE